MPSWPLTLPLKPLVDGYDESLPIQYEEKENDVGLPKRRKVSAMSIEELNVTFHLSEAQKGILKSFYKNECEGGVLPFTYTHPTEGHSITAYFLSKLSFTPAQRGVNYRTSFGLRIIY